jgi:hypothetical protein
MSLQHSVAGASLGDILERILDKGIVVAGDISISLVGVELLTIRVRLVIASVDRALQMGIHWWEGDASYRGPGAAAPPAEAATLRAENAALVERVLRLEQALSLGAPAKA